MPILTIILTTLGLVVFEVVSSIDNAIINADVLSTMRAKSRRWFLLWGMIIAVFAVRGLLPWIIAWATVPQLGPIGALTFTFSGDPAAGEAVKHSTPYFLIGSGVFLCFLFLNWLFLEEKRYGLVTEPYFQRKGVWFYAVVAIILAILVKAGLSRDVNLAFAAVIGSTAYFIVHGFRLNAEQQEERLMKGHYSDRSKLMYLEVLDTVFSIDGVLAAFAFTFSVPLILIGNGIGALVVRQLTVRGVKKIRNYYFLKNGAMYSIFVLGTIMILHSFGYHIPDYISPIAMFIIVGYFFLKSVRHIELQKSV